MYDVLRADRCISVNSLEARVPFGDLDFVEYVMSIDPEKKLNKYGMGKYLLRKAQESKWSASSHPAPSVVCQHPGGGVVHIAALPVPVGPF